MRLGPCRCRAENRRRKEWGSCLRVNDPAPRPAAERAHCAAQPAVGPGEVLRLAPPGDIVTEPVSALVLARLAGLCVLAGLGALLGLAGLLLDGGGRRLLALSLGRRWIDLLR